PRSEAQKEHRAAPVASQRLHGCIIDDLHRTLKGRFEVETDPALSKVSRLHDRPIGADQSGVTDGHRVVFPVFSELFHGRNHGLGSQVWTGFKRPSLVLSRSEYLHASSADVNCEHVHDSTLILQATRFKCSLLSAITCIRSFHDLTKDLAPSS